MPKLLLCFAIAFSACSFADSINDIPLAPNPSDLTTFSVSSDCPPAVCFFEFGLGTNALGNADFTAAGAPYTDNFSTANPIYYTWDGTTYNATFGYGGFFDMTGPNGLMFTGVVTGGTAFANGLQSNLYISFFGQWNNGTYGSGTASFLQLGGGQNSAALAANDAPEPSSFVLFGTGVLGLLAAIKRRAAAE